MESVEISFYKPQIRTEAYSLEDMKTLFDELPNLPQKQKIDELCDGLMKVCPFK